MASTEEAMLTTESLVYKCPHCSATVRVQESQIETVIDCPNPECERPFRVPAPSGSLLENQDRFEGDVDERIYESEGIADIEEPILIEHPAMLRNRPLLFLAMLVGLIGGTVGAVAAWAAGSMLLGWLSGLIGFVALIGFGIWWLQVMYETLTITNKRSIYRFGIISRRTNEVRHEDVRNIQVGQSIIERLLGVGRIAVSSAGQEDIEISVNGVPDPMGIADQIRQYQ